MLLEAHLWQVLRTCCALQQRKYHRLTFLQPPLSDPTYWFPPFWKIHLKKGPKLSDTHWLVSWPLGHFMGAAGSSGKKKGRGSSCRAVSCRSPSLHTDGQINLQLHSTDDATWKRAQPLPPVTTANRHHVSVYSLLLHLPSPVLVLITLPLPHSPSSDSRLSFLRPGETGLGPPAPLGQKTYEYNGALWLPGSFYLIAALTPAQGSRLPTGCGAAKSRAGDFIRVDLVYRENKCNVGFW